MLIRVTEQPIFADQALQALDLSIHGAVVTFMGTVRRYTGDRAVKYLDYEAYPEMAEAKLRDIALEAKAKFGLEDIAIIHRTCRLHIGETSLVVAVGSAHRREGFEACLHTVERIKEVVPVWKKEVWDAGSVWVNSEGA